MRAKEQYFLNLQSSGNRDGRAGLSLPSRFYPQTATEKCPVCSDIVYYPYNKPHALSRISSG